MTVRCELCGVVDSLEKTDGTWLCEDCRQCESPSAELQLDPIDDVSNDASLLMNVQPTERERVAVMERDVAGEETVWWASNSQSLSVRDERVHNGSTILVLAVDLEAGRVRELERYQVSSGDGDPELVPDQEGN